MKASINKEQQISLSFPTAAAGRPAADRRPTGTTAPSGTPPERCWRVAMSAVRGEAGKKKKNRRWMGGQVSTVEGKNFGVKWHLFCSIFNTVFVSQLMSTPLCARFFSYCINPCQFRISIAWNVRKRVSRLNDIANSVQKQTLQHIQTSTM